MSLAMAQNSDGGNRDQPAAKSLEAKAAPLLPGGRSGSLISALVPFLLLSLTLLAAPVQKQAGRPLPKGGPDRGAGSPTQKTTQTPLRNRAVAPTSLFAHVVVGGGYSTAFDLETW